MAGRLRFHTPRTAHLECDPADRLTGGRHPYLPILAIPSAPSAAHIQAPGPSIVRIKDLTLGTLFWFVAQDPWHRYNLS